MLRLPSPSLPRHLLGIALALTVAGTCMFVSSSPAQVPAPANSASIDAKLTIDAQDMDTRKVLELIARKGERNILVSDQVAGKITVHLKDVTWREALDIVAKSQGLVASESGNITLVDVAH
jgi:type IV pilus assembly protein PilQ